MRTKIFCIVMAVGLGSISVASGAAPAASPQTSRVVFEGTPPSPTVVVERLDTQSAYTDKRRVGLRSGKTASCPKAENWQVESLLNVAQNRTGLSYGQIEFYRGSDYRKTLKKLRHLGLDRYCIYTAQTSDLTFVPEPGLVAMEKDRLAVATTSAGGLPSDALSRKVWPTLAETFRGQTGQESPPPSGSASVFHPGTSTSTVRLTFLDSQPDGPDEKGVHTRPAEHLSQHGFTLIRFAQDLACPPSSGSSHCPIAIDSRQTLSDGSYNPSLSGEPAQRGHVGLVGDLATDIVTEVLRWKGESMPPKHLILNLSLGWDGEAFGDLDERRVSKLEPSVRAVYNALRLARESGVLVIAASGNRRGGVEKTRWPLLPAAWELRRPTYFPFAFGRKPVYAAGGVDWQELRLANSRDGGQPRRVAYADHAVTPDSLGNPTAIFTGTSVSAAVTSSVAAVVWHLRPELTPAEVMKIVTCSGEKLSSRADFYAWKKLWPLSKLVAGPRIRRLSLCPAVAKACGPQGEKCPSLPPLAECREPAPTMQGLEEKLAELIYAPPPTGKDTPQVTGQVAITSVDITSQRWVFPQPTTTPCPGCSLVPPPPPGAAIAGHEAYLALKITEKWVKEACAEGVAILSGTLYVNETYSKGIPSAFLSYTCPPADGTPGETPIHKIPLSDLEASSSGYKARIDFQVNKSSISSLGEITTIVMSVDNPVVIANVVVANKGS